MDIHTAMEESYKNGYAKGLEVGKNDSGKRGRWITHKVGLNIWAECSECLTCGSPHWKVCPVCEAKMEPPKFDDHIPGEKTLTIKNLKKGEVKVYGQD